MRPALFPLALLLAAPLLPLGSSSFCEPCGASSFVDLGVCIQITPNICITIHADISFPQPLEVPPNATISFIGDLLSAETATPVAPVLSGAGGTPLFMGQGGTMTFQNLILANGFLASGGGAAVQMTHGNVVLNNCTLVNNTVVASSVVDDDAPSVGGGAVSCVGAGTLTIEESFFVNNTCTNCVGGAVFSTCNVAITKSSFLHHSSSGSAPGTVAFIAAPAATATIETAIFANNSDTSASPSSPALVLSAVAKSELTGVTFAENVGGGLRFEVPASAPFLPKNASYTTTITGGVFANNSVAGEGGALQMSAKMGDLVVSSTSFSGNGAAKGGGAVSVEAPVGGFPATASFSGVTFLCNTVGAGNSTAVLSAASKLSIASSSFKTSAGCPVQLVAGSCTGECPR